MKDEKEKVLSEMQRLVNNGLVISRRTAIEQLRQRLHATVDEMINSIEYFGDIAINDINVTQDREFIALNALNELNAPRTVQVTRASTLTIRVERSAKQFQEELAELLGK